MSGEAIVGTQAADRNEPGNVALLTGFLMGMISGHARAFYEVADFDPDTGVIVIQHIATGDRYVVTVRHD
jgi:hypothetical protein